jgi:hypothetical protein
VGEVFYNCSSLTSITIPGKVISIAGQAFAKCTSLTSVTFAGTIPAGNFSTDGFSNIGDLRNKFYATDKENGTPGAYSTTAPVSSISEWTLE